MATLTFNGTNQYTEFSTLTGGLQNLTAGPHTLVVLARRTAINVFSDPFAVTNGALNTSYAAAKFSSANALAYDSNRLSVDDAIAHTSTTIWAMFATTDDTADTPDCICHFRDHTANAAWTHTNSSGNPAYAGAGTPGSTGVMQHGRWQNADFWTGQIGVAACWAARLTNAQLDELKANDRTSDWWNCTAGPPLHLVEFNVAETALVDLSGNSVRVAPTNAPTLTGPDPDRWTFDGTNPTAPVRTYDISQFPKYVMRGGGRL